VEAEHGCQVPQVVKRAAFKRVVAARKSGAVATDLILTGRDRPMAAIRRSTAVQYVSLPQLLSTGVRRCAPRSGFAERVSRNVQVHAATCGQVALGNTLPRKVGDVPANAARTDRLALSESMCDRRLSYESLG
jgi:hypothetical protein